MLFVPKRASVWGTWGPAEDDGYLLVYTHNDTSNQSEFRCQHHLYLLHMDACVPDCLDHRGSHDHQPQYLLAALGAGSSGCTMPRRWTQRRSPVCVCHAAYPTASTRSLCLRVRSRHRQAVTPLHSSPPRRVSRYSPERVHFSQHWLRPPHQQHVSEVVLI